MARTLGRTTVRKMQRGKLDALASKTQMIRQDELSNSIPGMSLPHILVHYPDRDPGTILLTDLELSIGRDEDCDLILQYPNVSRRHAIIRRNEDEYVIEDLHSTNGTFVNDVAIHRCVLRDNDQIRVGKVLSVFVRHLQAVQQP